MSEHLMSRVEDLEKRCAELEESLDHYRTAGDSATLRASQLTERNNYQVKRIAEMEDKIARLDVEGIAMGRVIAELEAERDRLKAALKDIARQMTLAEHDEKHPEGGGDVEFAYDELIRIARAALSGEGVT